MDPSSREHKDTSRGVIRVLEEHEEERGWRFRVHVKNHAGEGEHEVTLSFRDHDHWCSGSLAPSRLLESLLGHVLRRHREPLPAKFDAARIRRWLPDIDREFRGG